MKKLSEMNRQEVKEFLDKRFLPCMAMEVPMQAFVIPVTDELVEATRIWNEALELYLKEHFNELD